MDNGWFWLFFYGRKSFKFWGYLIFDFGGLIDRGILVSEDFERSFKGNNLRVIIIEEERESFLILWENIDVFVE